MKHFSDQIESNKRFVFYPQLSRINQSNNRLLKWLWLLPCSSFSHGSLTTCTSSSPSSTRALWGGATLNMSTSLSTGSPWPTLPSTLSSTMLSARSNHCKLCLTQNFNPCLEWGDISTTFSVAPAVSISVVLCYWSLITAVQDYKGAYCITENIHDSWFTQVYNRRKQSWISISNNQCSIFDFVILPK